MTAGEEIKLPRWFTADKPKGWFSRRHETRDANREARERYQHEHGRGARRRKARERLEAAA